MAPGIQCVSATIILVGPLRRAGPRHDSATRPRASRASQSNTYDAAGNLTADAQAGFTCSDRGRMSRDAIAANEVNYLYNGLAQRVSKRGQTAQVPTGTHRCTYGEGGSLIGEYDHTATPRTRHRVA
ncbi:MAG: hypothetical protein O9296_17330 [Novosphingobium sp.]|jgi:hypothetical protein|nr:hypothetical protein [Novosphingobium sp.]